MAIGRPLRDLSGQRFGRLTALFRHQIANETGSYWICACDCGKSTRSRADALLIGRAASCGCLSAERAAVHIKAVGHANKIDLVGRRFNRLLVLSEAARSRTGHIQWMCKCDCGAVKSVFGSNLTKGKTQSCGCLDLEQKIIHGLSNTPGYKAASCSKRRARKNGAGGHYTEKQMRALYVLQAGCCRYCGVSLRYEDIRRDHWLPIALGGASDIANMQILCDPCNLRKGSKHPVLFEQQLMQMKGKSKCLLIQ